MMFYQTFIFLFLSLCLSCNALLCTNDCFFTFNLTTPFSIPDKCNRLIQAGKCVGSIGFWYNRGEYLVSLQADPSSTMFALDNRRYVLLDCSSTISTFFSYSIDRVCQNKDDCARDLIKNVADDMLRRQYNYSAIMNEVQPLVIGPSLTPDEPNLNCYDSSQNAHQCGTSTTPGACVISDTISKKKRSITCDTKLDVGDAYINIYQSDNDYALFEVYCNRSLCNSQSTLQTAKELMFKYGVTITEDGRLDGSRLIISTSLMIIMIFFLLTHRFK